MNSSRRLRLSPVDSANGRPTLVWWFLLSLAAITLFAVAVPVTASAYAVPVVLAFLVAGAQAAALLLAPVWPAPAAALFSLTLVGLPLLTSTPANDELPWPWPVTTMISFSLVVASIAFYRGWRLGLGCYLAGVAVSVATLATVPADRVEASVVNIFVVTCVAGVVYLLAVLVAQRQNIRRQLLEERAISAAEHERRQLIEERHRIARELHDVVAHGMSLIQVQATTAKYRLPELDPAAAAEFDDIGASARGAMVEMRRLLGVLRAETEQTALAPQPGIADIANLVDAASKAGATITLDEPGLPAALAPSLQIATFRIAQEAVSNALRHSPGARIAITLSAEPQPDGQRAVVVTIDNGPPTHRPEHRATESGHGLIGMRERVALLGGVLDAGPLPDNGYRVRAILPVHPTAIPEDPA